MRGFKLKAHIAISETPRKTNYMMKRSSVGRRNPPLCYSAYERFSTEKAALVRGEWVYLYRAVDKVGKAADFFLSRQRDVDAAKAFLRKTMKGQRVPAKVTLDAYAASHRAVADLKRDGELPKRVVVRSSKYLNNLIEQDHRRIKQRLRSLLELKSFKTADIVISGIELAEKIKKGQFKLGKLGGHRAMLPEIWRAVLAASSISESDRRNGSARICVASQFAPEPTPPRTPPGVPHRLAYSFCQPVLPGLLGIYNELLTDLTNDHTVGESN